MLAHVPLYHYRFTIALVLLTCADILWLSGQLPSARWTKYPADEGGLLSSMQALLYAATRQERLAELQIWQAKKGKDFIHFHHTEYNIASAYALMHRDALAIQWLQMAAGEGFPCYPVFARDPNLANLKNEPRFVQFIADQKKQWESYKTAF